MLVYLFSREGDFCKVHRKIYNVNNVLFYDGMDGRYIDVIINDDVTYTFNLTDFIRVKIFN